MNSIVIFSYWCVVNLRPVQITSLNYLDIRFISVSSSNCCVLPKHVSIKPAMFANCFTSIICAKFIDLSISILHPKCFFFLLQKISVPDFSSAYQWEANSWFLKTPYFLLWLSLFQPFSLMQCSLCKNSWDIKCFACICRIQIRLLESILLLVSPSLIFYLC